MSLLCPATTVTYTHTNRYTSANKSLSVVNLYYRSMIADCWTVIMAAQCNRAGHYIFVLWFLLLSSSSFCLSLFSSPILSRRRLDVAFSANVGCRSEMCCTRLAENTGRKKSSKIRHLGTIAQLCQAVSFQLRHVSTIGKKVLNSNISSTCPHNMVNFGPLTAEVGLPVWAP